MVACNCCPLLLPSAIASAAAGAAVALQQVNLFGFLPHNWARSYEQIACSCWSTAATSTCFDVQLAGRQRPVPACTVFSFLDWGSLNAFSLWTIQQHINFHGSLSLILLLLLGRKTVSRWLFVLRLSYLSSHLPLDLGGLTLSGYLAWTDPTTLH